MKFVLNFCIYLGSEGASVKHQHADEIKGILAGKKRKNLRNTVKAKLERLENDRIFLVGTDVIIDNELREHIRRGGGRGQVDVPNAGAGALAEPSTWGRSPAPNQALD
jgi:predicted AlkP superfamily phosphohydrolase/phosphomutase